MTHEIKKILLDFFECYPNGTVILKCPEREMPVTTIAIRSKMTFYETGIYIRSPKTGNGSFIPYGNCIFKFIEGDW